MIPNPSLFEKLMFERTQEWQRMRTQQHLLKSTRQTEASTCPDGAVHSLLSNRVLKRKSFVSSLPL